MPKRIDVAALKPIVGSLYPAPYHEPCRTRERRRIGDAAGLTQYGVNMLRLPPGAWSSQRHWHTAGDELVYVVQGEVVLVTDEGEELLRAGDAAGFKAGDPVGHHLQNRSAADAVLIEIGTRLADEGVHYPGIDLMLPAGRNPPVFTHRDGTPYPPSVRRGA